MTLRILFIGDVVGKSGRDILAARLPYLMAELAADLVVVNGENAAGGVGLTPAVAKDFFSLGVDAITLGNHAWDKKEILPFIDQEDRLVRPANYPPGTPGRGATILRTKGGEDVGLLNLAGRVFSPVHFDCPFRAADRELENLGKRVTRILVDIHAEATSEKIALGRYLDGQVSAVVGTHTHVQTADESILPGGTAYITDVGMTGPADSIIGVRQELVLERFLTQRPVRFQVAEEGSKKVNGVLIVLEGTGGKALEIKRIAELHS